MSLIEPVKTPNPTREPRPPACPMCGSKMLLVGVSPATSKYTILDTYSYRCEPCGQSQRN